MVTSVREGLSPENADLLAKMDAIGPWHMNVRINEELNTGMTSAKDSEKSLSPSLLSKEKHFKSIIRRAYPEGLASKSFSDHACNSGGYCFWAKDVGAASTFGYDVRDHWINQANFIKAHRSADNANMRFEVMDLYDLPKRADVGEFDVTWFSGIFYHLPDPVTGLKIAAERTRELIYVSTATQNYLDPEPEKGALFGSLEGKEYLMTGVHNLNWLPSGPNCLQNILDWLGFPHMRVIRWTKQVINTRRPGDKVHTVGRISVVASRDRGRVEAFRNPQIIDSAKLDWERRGARHGGDLESER